jgi:hypothetical protein
MKFKPVTITLTRARIKEEVWAGEYDGLVVASVSDLSSNASIQINNTSEAEIVLRPGWGFRVLDGNDKIRRIFMTNDAVGGDVEFIFLDGASIDLISRITTVALEEGLASQVVTVTDVATELPSTALAGRILLVLQNGPTNTVALGPSGVTYASGLKMLPGEEKSEYAGPSVKFYGICDTGLTSDVIVFEGK